MFVLVLLASSMFIRDYAAVCVLRLSLLLAVVFTGRVSDDNIIVIHLLVSGSSTFGIDAFGIWVTCNK